MNTYDECFVAYHGERWIELTSQGWITAEIHNDEVTDGQKQYKVARMVKKR